MSHSNESSNSNYPIYDNYVLQMQNQQKHDRRSPRGTLHNVLNSPDLAEVHIQPQSVKVGRSPNLFDNSPNSTGSIDYTSLCSSDNIVVYDDIGRNWLNLNKTSDEQENIIEYDISPKRCIGNTLDSNVAMESFDNQSKTRFVTATSPARKPGFPKRITLPSNYDSQHAITDTTTANTPSHVFSDEISKESTLDYLYEFSETRKVLEDFFSEPSIDPIIDDSDSECDKSSDNAYIGQRLAHLSNNQYAMNESPKRSGYYDMELYLDSNSSGDVLSKESLPAINRQKATNNVTLSPDSIEHDSNSGDLDSLPNDINCTVDQNSLFSGMPVLEDGLSSGHASDTDVHTNDINCAEYQDTNKADDMDDEQKVGTVDGEAAENNSVESTLRDIHSTLQRTKILLEISNPRTKNSENPPSPNVWVRRDSINTPDSINSDRNPSRADDEEADTDLETDRLLGQQRLDNIGNLEKRFNEETTAIPRPAPQFSSATLRQGIGTSLTSASPVASHPDGMQDNDFISPIKMMAQKSPSGSTNSNNIEGNRKRNKEVRWEPAVLIEGVLFRAKYLGSTQLVCEGQPTKSTRMMQAEEAVSRIKAPDGESQPSTEVDLFISTEKIMVLNTDLKEIMMDHALRTISYIADIGDLVVLMARRRYVPNGTNDESSPDTPKPNRTPKMICHVFMSEEAQFIAQSIGQAFQVAYMEFLKANGIEDHSFVKEMDYQEVLNSQEIFGDELEIFAKKELQKEVVVPKAKGEILGVVIVESGWGSMLPTVVIANLLSSGAAARCGQLNIGDQIIAINGMSLVGLPLTLCQSYIRNTKSQTAVKFTVVPCPPVVEVKIKRPNTKYQLGFSVQNGVICSLLRGGIAERGGVRVGHRIIEINNQSVVAVPHEKIVSLLATSVGEILMKTMPTSMFRLLTGQESPLYI